MVFGNSAVSYIGITSCHLW